MIIFLALIFFVYMLACMISETSPIWFIPEKKSKTLSWFKEAPSDDPRIKPIADAYLRGEITQERMEHKIDLALRATIPARKPKLSDPTKVAEAYRKHHSQARRLNEVQLRYEKIEKRYKEQQEFLMKQYERNAIPSRVYPDTEVPFKYH